MIRQKEPLPRNEYAGEIAPGRSRNTAGITGESLS